MGEKGKNPAAVSYSEAERQQVINHIEGCFGECSHFYIMDNSQVQGLNLLVFAPTDARPWYTMVTLGMGGFQLNVPEILRSDEDDIGHVELVERLPAYWKFDAESLKEERWYWPIKLLEYVISLGTQQDAFLDFGYKQKDLMLGGPEGSPFTGIVLMPPTGISSDFSLLRLEGGREIRFCEIGTFFQEEMAFVEKYSYSDLSALMESCPDSDFPVFLDQKRMNYGSDETLKLPWARELVEQLEKSQDTFAKYMNQMMERFSSDPHHHHHHHHDQDE